MKCFTEKDLTIYSLKQKIEQIENYLLEFEAKADGFAKSKKTTDHIRAGAVAELVRLMRSDVVQMNDAIKEIEDGAIDQAAKEDVRKPNA